MTSSNHLFTDQLDKILSLRQGNSTAPHKPILLLSILDVIQEFQLQENKIPVDQHLFKVFEYNWTLFATEYSGFNMDISQPLYYMQNDKVGWQLISSTGKAVNKHIRSQRILKKEVAYGRLDESLFLLLQPESNRDFFRGAVIAHYFGTSAPKNVIEDRQPLSLKELDMQLINEPKPTYQTETINKEIFHFYRHQGFRIKVRKIYNFTCCMSGWRVDTPSGIIEACHIQDHAHAGVDVLSNGLALCPNLHRAFDYGLISLKDDYTILVASKQFFTENEHEYTLSKLRGKRIKLPENNRFYPSPIFLEWHRSEKFEKK